MCAGSPRHLGKGTRCASPLHPPGCRRIRISNPFPPIAAPAPRRSSHDQSMTWTRPPAAYDPSACEHWNGRQRAFAPFGNLDQGFRALDHDLPVPKRSSGFAQAGQRFRPLDDDRRETSALPLDPHRPAFRRWTATKGSALGCAAWKKGHGRQRQRKQEAPDHLKSALHRRRGRSCERAGRSGRCVCRFRHPLRLA